MRVAAVTLVLALAGCDSLFNLDHVPPGGGIDSAIDSPASDGAPDADRCAVAADEDTDGLVDPCDPCPTVGNPDPADVDTDGLPNVCDPNLGANMRDQILYRAMLSDAAELAQFVHSGDTYIAANHGQVQLTAGGKLTSLSVLAPTKVEFRISGASGTTNLALVRVSIGTLSCEVTGADCGTNTNTAQLCARVKSGTTYGSGVTSGFPMSALTTITLGKQAPMSSTAICEIRSGGAGPTAALTAGIPQDMVQIEPGNQSLFVNSVVVYGTL